MIDAAQSPITEAPLCQWCGARPAILCPRVKALEWFQDGTLKRVEFKTETDYLSPGTYIPSAGSMQRTNYIPEVFRVGPDGAS